MLLKRRISFCFISHIYLMLPTSLFYLIPTRNLSKLFYIHLYSKIFKLEREKDIVRETSLLKLNTQSGFFWVSLTLIFFYFLIIKYIQTRREKEEISNGQRERWNKKIKIKKLKGIGKKGCDKVVDVNAFIYVLFTFNKHLLTPLSQRYP